MFSLLRSWLLGILRVPPEPQAPVGDPASTRVFRASPKFYFLRLLGWGLGQLFALVGLIVGVLILPTFLTFLCAIRPFHGRCCTIVRSEPR